MAPVTLGSAAAPETEPADAKREPNDAAAFKGELSQAAKRAPAPTKMHPHQVRAPAKRAKSTIALPGVTVAPAQPAPATPEVPVNVLQVVVQVVETILAASAQPNAQPVVDVPHAPEAIAAPVVQPPPQPSLEELTDVEATPVSADAATRFASETPMTPLERAIHEAIAEAKRGSGATDSDTIPMPHITFDAAPDRAQTPSAAMPVKNLPGVAPIQAPAELPVATSHVHLVVGDGAERIVLTVAVRGSNVHVALRGADEHASAALARNAAVLDDALRVKQLRLAELDTTDGAHPESRDRREKPHYEAPELPQEDEEVYEH